MALGSSHWSKYGTECIKCGSKDKLTRHHEMDSNLHKTGKIIVLCRECHQEFHYVEQQMQAENNKIVKRLRDEIKATENLLNEGNPFMLSPNDYLQNLKCIEGTLFVNIPSKESGSQ